MLEKLLLIFCLYDLAKGAIIVLTFSLFFQLTTNGQTRQFQFNDVKAIADGKAQELWGVSDPATAIPYYGPEDEIIAYHFNYSLYGDFPDKSSLIDNCKNAHEQGNRDLSWGKDSYANIVVGANTSMPVIIEYSKCLSKQYALGAKLKEFADLEFGSGYEWGRIYYLGLVDVWFCVKQGNIKKYVNLEPVTKILEEKLFWKYANSKNYFWEQDNFDEGWVKIMDNKDPAGGSTVYCPGYEQIPFLEWSFGCTPSSAAMLLAWWDNYQNFGNLIDYHMERWDTIQENYDYHVPWTQRDLKYAMNTSGSGTTQRWDICDGYIEVVEDRGYSCSSDSHWAAYWTVEDLFDDVKGQINNNRPLHVSIDGHSIIGVGYNNDNKTIKTHDPNLPTIRTITRSMLEATYWVVVSNNYGTSVDLLAPNGGSQWKTNVGDDKETLESNDFFEINWSCPQSDDTYVKLYYHDEGGLALDEWSLIDDNTENDGQYIWHVPNINCYYGTSTSHARIKIEVYDLSNNLIASDGSFGNFNINAGGGLPEITGVEYTESNPDFYFIDLANQNWSVVGIRDFWTSDFWYLEMFDDIEFTNMLEECHKWEYANYIVLNGHNLPSGSYGIKPWCAVSSNLEASIQFDNNTEELSVNSTQNFTWTHGDVVKIWDVLLAPGNYYFELDVDSLSPADFDIALFKWGEDNIFPMDDNVAHSSNIGGGIDESFHYSPFQIGNYGLCISSNNGVDGNFDISIYSAGKWTGALSTNWDNPANWSSNLIPTADDNVIIPSGLTNYPKIWAESAFCNNLTIENGASLEIMDEFLIIYGDITIFGQLIMSSELSVLTAHNSIVWETGSSASITHDDALIEVYRGWYFQDGANVSLTNGIVKFISDNPGFILVRDEYCYFNDVVIQKQLGTLQYHLLSTHELYIFGDLTVNSGSTFTSSSENNINLKGGLSTYGNIALDAGTFKLIGDGILLELNSGDYFNNLDISTSSGCILWDDLHLKGDFILSSGGILTAADIYVGGSWFNYDTGDLFIEGTNAVIFNGGHDSYCYGEEFYELELANSGLHFPDGTTTCELFKYTNGQLIFSGGIFTANDLYNTSGINGEITMSAGEANFHQSVSNQVHLDADLYISGGTLNIYGGAGDSYWATNNSIEIHMEGGVIDFKDGGINIFNNLSTTVYTEISGGVIRTSGNLVCDRPDFNPGGGTFELYGLDQNTITCVPQSHFYNIGINKVETKSYNTSKSAKASNKSKSIQSNNVILSGNLYINGDLNISSGSLDINGYILEIAKDINIDGALTMNNSSDLLYVHGNVQWNSGSISDVSEGLLLVGQNFSVNTGASVQFGINNILKFTGDAVSEFSNNAAGTTLGNLEFNKTDNYTKFSPSSNSTQVGGSLLIYPDNEVRFSGCILYTAGDFLVDDNSVAKIENSAYLSIDSQLTNHGNIWLTSGSIYGLNDFSSSTSSEIVIDDGFFVLDRPYSATYYFLAGDITMNGGMFKVTNEGINQGPSSNINMDGGTIKIGWGLLSNYSGNFNASNGVVHLFGPSTGAVSFETSNFMHNLIIDKSSTGLINMVDNLIVKNDVTVLNNELNIGASDLTIGGDLTIASSGILNASNGDIYIGGDWINNAGESGFIEGYRTVYFEGDDVSHIVNDETFSTVVINLSGGPYSYVYADPNTTINFTGDLSIDGCSFRLDENATINIDGDIIINQNTGLFASSIAETNINLKGFWNNYNTTGYPFDKGFFYGKSTVKFYTDGEAGIEVSGGIQEFYNLQLSKGIGHFNPYADITVHNDVFILSGIWDDDESGLTHTFLGNLTIWEQGLIDDISNTFVFAGEGQQDLYNGSGTTVNLGNLYVQKNISISGSFPLLLLHGDLHCNGSAVIDSGDFHINNYTLECGEELTINEDGRVIAPGQSSISMGSGGTLTVNGGALELVGDATNAPIITSSSGHYEFSITNQGLLTATHTVFENMDINGVRIYNTGLVYGTNAFSNCTFQDGTVGGTLLRIDNNQDLVVNGAIFPDNTWSGTYNVTKEQDQGTVTLINVTGNFTGPSFENDPYNRIGWEEMVPGIWEGTQSHSWNDPDNWEYSLKPTASDDVYIPDGTPNDPWIATTDQECNNLTIESGASLRIYDEILTVHGDMIIYGELKMDHASGVLNAGDWYGDMISWESGSTDDITMGTINVYSNWYFKNGTDAQLGIGNTVNFYGPNRSFIYCDDDNASFGSIDINKTSPPKDYVQLVANDTLRVSDNLYVYDGKLELISGSYVNVNNEFYIESGCTLSAIGSSASEITISGYPNYCVLEINNGATISAEYTIFEFLESNGLAVNPTAIIDAVHPLHYCTFREGKSEGSLITIANTQTLTINGANFPPNSWGGSYNVTKQNNDGHLTFTNVEGVFVGTNFEKDPYNRIDWPGVVPGIWTGEGNSLWNVLVNWKYQMKPTASDEVFIPAGCPYDPRVTLLPQECKDIEIEAGASLEIFNQTLTVHDYLINNGELIMNHPDSKLNIGDSKGGHISWELGSTSDITAGYINVYGNWYFQNGTNAQLGAGNLVTLGGDFNSTIYCYDPNAEFGSLKVKKTSSPDNNVFIPPNTTVRINEDLNITGGIFSMDEGTTLTVQNEIYVDDGAIFAAKGAVGNEVLVSGYPSHSKFEIASGGTILAALTSFEYFDENGIYIADGAIIDPTYPFYNCTFSESFADGTLLSIDNDQVVTIEGASFPPNTWTGDYNVKKNSDLGQITFTEFTGDFSGDNFENDPNNRIDWHHPWYNVNLKVFLEGPYESGEMNTNLDNIPNSQPFNMPPWNYDGLENTPIIPIDVVDWILVELRDASDAASATSATMVDRKAAFLSKEGYIKDLGGLLDLQFNEQINYNLFVVIWHRNHLGVMSAYPLVESDGVYEFDFSAAMDQAYGGANAHKEVESGIWATFAADGNSDGFVNSIDESPIWKNEAGTKGYISSDYNLNGESNNIDKNEYWYPNIGKGSQIPQ